MILLLSFVSADIISMDGFSSNQGGALTISSGVQNSYSPSNTSNIPMNLNPIESFLLCSIPNYPLPFNIFISAGCLKELYKK